MGYKEISVRTPFHPKPLLAILGAEQGLPTLVIVKLMHCPAFPGQFQRVLWEGSLDFQLQERKPISPKKLAQATTTDPVLSQVIRYCRDGWPATVATDLQPYQQKQAELGWEAGCVFRVVILTKLRSQVLKESHDSHPDIVRMKGLARSRMWWPGITRVVCRVVRHAKGSVTSLRLFLYTNGH